MNDFATYALQRRTEKGLTQQQVAEMAGISLRQYQVLETGHCLPRLTTAVQIAAVLELDLNQLRDSFLPPEIPPR